jgi:hypothetical protein
LLFGNVAFYRLHVELIRIVKYLLFWKGRDTAAFETNIVSTRPTMD